jgi:hypothetical protein
LTVVLQGKGDHVLLKGEVPPKFESKAPSIGLSHFIMSIIRIYSSTTRVTVIRGVFVEIDSYNFTNLSTDYINDISNTQGVSTGLSVGHNLHPCCLLVTGHIKACFLCCLKELPIPVAESTVSLDIPPAKIPQNWPLVPPFLIKTKQ